METSPGALRALGRLLARLVLVVAWLILVLGAGLLVLEESGVLARVLRTSVAWRLGPLGDGLEIEQVGLRWFEPGVEIHDVRLRTPSPSSKDAGRGDVLLHLARVHFSIDPNLGQRPLRQLHIDGGKVRVSNRLIEGLSRFAESWGGGSGAPPPAIVVTDLEVDLELPGEESILDLGKINLIATPSARGITLRGELVPTFSGAVRGTGSIQAVGSQLEPGRFEVRATVDGLPLETSEFHMPASLGPMPVEAFAGKLSLSASATIDLTEAFAATGSLRARLFDARLLPRRGDPWLESLTVDLDAKVAIERDQDLWSREGWDTVLRARADWRSKDDPTISTPVEVWGLFGKQAPAGAWARSFARVERLPLTPPALRAIGATDEMTDLWKTWEALTPEGIADVTLDSILRRVRERDGTYRYPLRSAATMQHVGESAMTYRGFEVVAGLDPRALPGDRMGIPMRATNVRGQVVLTYDEERRGSWSVALAGMRAEHSSGTAFGWGTIGERTDATGLPGPYLDIGFSVPEMELDPEWRRVLSTSYLTRQIWTDYNPAAGRASTEWRLRDAPDTFGLTASGDVRVNAALLSWTPLPVSMSEMTGRVKIRWSERSARFDFSDREPEDGEPLIYRPFGVAWDLSNPTSSGVRARVRGMVREDSMPPVLPADFDPQADHAFWSLDVDVEEMGLKGSDSDHLAAFAESFAELREELRAVGKLQLSYSSVQPWPGAPYLAHVEARPLVARITPKLFPRQATDLTGRVLLGLTFEGDDPEDVVSDARATLAGRWPRDVALAANVEVAPSGETTMQVHAAGPDPNDPGLRGAFEEAYANEQQGNGVDLSETSLSGALDFELLSRFRLDAPPEETRNTFRLFLRECSLVNASLRLDGLRGVLVASDDVLRGDELEAELAGHPLVLEDVLVFPLARAAELPEVDPLLLRSGFLADATGTATQASVRTKNLPMDEEHLASLMDAETIQTMRESRSWHGLLDLLAARVLITSPPEGDGVVVLSGSIRPHDVTLSFGLPIEVRTADVDVREMVLERGGVRTWARIGGLDGSLAGRELRNASMILALVDQRLSIDDLEGEFVGGRLRSLGSTGQGSRKALGVDLAAPHRFDVALSMEDVQVDRLLRGVFQSSIADAGLLRATLQLAGTPDDVLGLHGRGQMRLTEGRLWSIPAMRVLFTRLGFPNTAVFDQLDTRFEIRDGVIDTHHVLVKSSLLKLFGNGTLDLDGRLAYDLDVRYSLLDRLGILNRLIYWLNRSLIRVAVRGDFARPEVLIRSSILELFSGAPDDELRGLPVPEFAPLPPRF